MTPDPNRAGLCPGCVHARPVRSARGSLFLRCARHDVDPRWPKYPRLPVLACTGFDPAGETGRPAIEGRA